MLINIFIGWSDKNIKLIVILQLYGCVHFSFVLTKEKRNQKEKELAIVPVLKTNVFSGPKRTRCAQTAFCPFRKMHLFSLRTFTKGRSGLCFPLFCFQLLALLLVFRAAVSCCFAFH